MRCGFIIASAARGNWAERGVWLTGLACELEQDHEKDIPSCNVERYGHVTRVFLENFARNRINNPCTGESQCSGDFDCDGAVDASDVNKFLEDFGRSLYNDPCPPCLVGDWCVY